VARDTVEESILALHAEKRKLVAAVLDGSGSAAALSTEDLVELRGDQRGNGVDLSAAPAPPRPVAASRALGDHRLRPIDDRGLGGDAIGGSKDVGLESIAASAGNRGTSRGSAIPVATTTPAFSTDPDTKPSSAPGTASHDAFSRQNSPLSIESAELRPYVRHHSPLIAMNPEPRPYSRRTSRLSIESGEL